MNKTLGLILLLLMMSYSARAQNSFKGNITSFSLNYGFYNSAADLKKRYGTHFQFGTNIIRQTEKNYTYGLQFQYIFGSNVNEDVLAPLRNLGNDILGFDGLPAIVFLRQRGFVATFNFGKILTRNESKSGIKLDFGFGLMQHWIRLQDDANSLPQITGDYRFGYDRKTRGLALSQFLGYQFMKILGGAKATIGFEIQEGLTKNVRPYNFNSTLDPAQTRLDISYGLKVSWIFPFYNSTENSEEIFY